MQKWLCVVLLMVGASGLLGSKQPTVVSMGWFRMDLGFHLSDTVLVALLSSTTVTVLGMYGLAVRWLFPSGVKMSQGKFERNSD